MKFCLQLFFPLLILSTSTTGGDMKSQSAFPNSGDFDFWLGEWNLRWIGADGKESRGTNSVTKILGGYVVHESFKDPNTGFEGMSYSVFDTTQKRWLQTWVDNAGGYLDFVGGFSDGIMTLERLARRGEKEFKQRMVWYNIGEDSLDWNWERSDDEGQTWTQLWKIHYSRKK